MVRPLLLLLILTLFSCESRVNTPQELKINFSFEEGKTWVYQVSKTIYTPTDEPAVQNYYYRETVGPLIDEGQNIYLLERYISTNNRWETIEPHQIQTEPDRLTLFSNGTSKVLLQLPIFDGQKWNGESATIFSASALPIGFEVVMKNDSSAISNNFESITYDLNQGPVKRKILAVEYCQETTDCIGKGIITSGSETLMELLSTNPSLPEN